MDLSRKTDYALRMVAELVEHEGQIVSVRVAAENRGVPYSFARSIQRDLAHAGIIESTRGSRGGMRLLMDPKKTTVRSVVEALQGPIKISACEHSGEDGGGPVPSCRTVTLIPCGARQRTSCATTLMP